VASEQPAESHDIELYAFDPKVAGAQVAKLNRIRHERDNAAVSRGLGRVRDQARKTGNLMEPILEAVKAYATLGEVAGAMKDIFGEHKEPVAL
jgi:methylmalonyl-CoA mutase N-terminal domain/subunit